MNLSQLTNPLKQSALHTLMAFTVVASAAAPAYAAQTPAPVATTTLEVKESAKPTMDYKFSVEDQAKIKAVEKAATSIKGSAFEKKNLDIRNDPATASVAGTVVKPGVVTTVAAGAGAAVIATTASGAGVFKEVPPAAATSAAPTLNNAVASQGAVEAPNASQAAGQPPLFKTLEAANAAGINPLASAPKIGTPDASAAKPEQASSVDMSTESTLMDRISKNIVKLLFGLVLIGGGVWLFLRKE